MTRVGFVGLGNMGVPMTARLAEAGYDVRGFDVDPAARARAGGVAVETLADAAAGADAVILMLAELGDREAGRPRRRPARRCSSRARC